MKRILLTALTILASLPMLAQLNVQMHFMATNSLTVHTGQPPSKTSKPTNGVAPISL